MAREPIRKTRIEESNDNTYTPPSDYDIPDEVKELFAKDGYHLRWIRVLIDNQDDYKNVADRRREGYEPVSISELPPEARDLFETKSFGSSVNKYSNITMVGDLALFKVPLKKAQARTRYYENMALQNEIAQRKQLGADSKLNKLLPITDESKTVVRTGGGRSASAPEGFGKTLRNTSKDSEDDAE